MSEQVETCPEPAGIVVVVSERTELSRHTFEDSSFFLFDFRTRIRVMTHAEGALYFNFELVKVETIPRLYNPLSV